MHNVESPAQQARWSRLVDQLEERLDELAQAFTTKVRDIPEYGESQVTVQEIRNTARETFRRLIRGLKGTHPDSRDGLLEFASDLGAKRAQAGIPPESLTTAVRLDFSILWAELLEIATPEDAILLASRVDKVWGVVDEFATRTHTSYLTERVRMAQEESSIQREFVARLFNQSTPSVETSAQVASALGINADSRFALVAASGEPGARLGRDRSREERQSRLPLCTRGRQRRVGRTAADRRIPVHVEHHRQAEALPPRIRRKHLCVLGAAGYPHPQRRQRGPTAPTAGRPSLRLRP